MKILRTINYYEKVPCVSGKQQFVPRFCGKNLLTKPIIDTCSFVHSDKTLEPKFIKHLLELGAENSDLLQKYTKIKDEMLRAMGYKHTENLKLVLDENEMTASYEVTQGEISISNKKNMSIPMFIATLRHELEHFNQFVKIYKTKGEKAFLDALIKAAKTIHPELNPFEKNINLNKNFYKIMSKDADTMNFDSKKYYKAMCEYTNFSYDASQAYKYYNNLLEKEAYSVERKILSSLGEDPVVSADEFPHNYKTLLKLMNSRVPLQYQDNVLQVFRLASHIKSLETAENFKKIWKIWINKQKNIEIKPEDEELLNQSFNKVNETYLGHPTLKKIQLDKKCSKQIETWFRHGIYYFENILKDV